MKIDANHKRVRISVVLAPAATLTFLLSTGCTSKPFSETAQINKTLFTGWLFTEGAVTAVKRLHSGSTSNTSNLCARR